ncbi:MAG TPA: heparan-alpha-glucosaminide N-acetyltransferase domain-containing protein [Vicinamibacterales bacterium]
MADPQPTGGTGGQSRRVVFIDLARALATVFMLYGHTVAALLAPEYQRGTWFEIWVFQRGLTSSLFLLLSGFAFSIATSKRWAQHGHLSAAFVRRTRRFLLFMILGYALHFPVSRFADLASAAGDRWQSFLAVDVLQLIGATFLGVQLLVIAARTRRAFTIALFVLAFVTIVLTDWVWSLDVSHVPAWIAAFLSPKTGSQFPLFPWAAFILTGAALGQFYVESGSAPIARYANRLLLIPGLALFGGALIIGALPMSVVGDAWDAMPTQVALRMGPSLIVLGAIAHASRRVTRLPHVFGAVAQETLLIYFIHLCIVYGSIWNSGLVQRFGPTLSPLQTLACVVVLIGAMVVLANYWNRLKHVRPRSARWVSIGAGGLLVYSLL